MISSSASDRLEYAANRALRDRSYSSSRSSRSNNGQYTSPYRLIIRARLARASTSSCSVGSKSLAESCVTETAKVQKQVIGNRIIGEGCEANPDWRPGWMHCPPMRIIEGAGSSPAKDQQVIQSKPADVQASTIQSRTVFNAGSFFVSR